MLHSLLRPLLFLLLCGHAAAGIAQLSRPLTFVSPDNILMVNPQQENIVQRALAVDPSLIPSPFHLSRQQVQLYRRLYRQAYMPQALDSLAGLLLVSGDARYAHAIEAYKHQLLDSLDHHPTPRTAAALLRTIGMRASTCEDGLYLHLLDDCMIIAKTQHFSITVDQIAEQEGHKYRISEVSSSKKSLTLRFRLPHPTRRVVFYMNGRRLLAPRYEKGYLVVKHEWREGDELFYRYL